jgi:DNA-binding transcriptional ArsR family regulator
MPEQLTKEELKALAAEARQEMLKMLSKRPYTASEIAKVMGKHVTTVTEHLDNLEKTGLIARKEDGHKWKYYVLTSKGEKLFKPQFYSWAIVLSISFVAIVIGGGIFSSSLFIGASAYQRAESLSDSAAAIGAEAPAAPPQPPPVDLVPLVPIALVILGLAGIAWALYLKRKAKIQVLSALG